MWRMIRRRQPRSRAVAAVAILTPFLFPALCSGRDTPLAPLGIQVRGALGEANSLSFRDFIVAKESAPWATFSVSHRGFSLSAWGSVGAEDGKVVSEVFASYSHKLPLIDLHLGVARVSIPSLREKSPLAGRLVLSSNVSSSKTIDLTFDHSLEGGGTTYGGAITFALIQGEAWLLDARAGATFMNDPDFKGDGWSLRLLASRRLASGVRPTAFLGYSEGSTRRRRSPEIADGVIAGFSLTFR
jgi:hypothetical protein